MDMKNIGASAFDSAWAALPDGRVQLRIGTEIIQRAICLDNLGTAEMSAEGRYEKANYKVRVKSSDESKRNPLKLDARVDLLLAGSTEWKPMRISARKDPAGLITLNLETPAQ